MTFTGALSHDGGEDVGTYPIIQGTLALSSNYSLTFIGATLTITPRPVTVTANTLSKVYGDSDPMLTYSITSGSLALGDTFSGALIREAGENAGDLCNQSGRSCSEQQLYPDVCRSQLYHNSKAGNCYG